MSLNIFEKRIKDWEQKYGSLSAQVQRKIDKLVEQYDKTQVSDKESKVLSITNTIYVIGGGMMYKSMLPYCDEVIVNKVKAIDPETTVFFPNMDEEKDFVVSKVDEVQIDNGYETQFYVYERKPVEVPIKTPKLKLTTAMHITEENLDLFEEALRR